MYIQGISYLIQFGRIASYILIYNYLHYETNFEFFVQIFCKTNDLPIKAGNRTVLDLNLVGDITD